MEYGLGPPTLFSLSNDVTETDYVLIILYFIRQHLVWFKDLAKAYENSERIFKLTLRL